MPEKYEPYARAALFVLMLNHGELTNPDLKNKYGVDLRPVGRAKLIKAGLLETETAKRPYIHRITPAGKDWCERALADLEPPERSGGLVRIGFEFLRHLARYARKHGISIADLVAGDETLEELIRRVYQELAPRPKAQVRLAHLRPKLDGAERKEVDQTLFAMTKTGLVHLSPDSDRRNLTDADRAAAIRIGTEDKHFVAIEEI